MIDHAYLHGYAEGRLESAEKIKQAFNDLPSSADMATKDLLLDLYNEIKPNDN